ncbi:MAG: cob(I)yrinic acid a,c-diamide adenosyltransferase [Desulfovibrionaceae bacterium]|nr:cob(I)yrinic acid a,c-diamide adenosyltransferase [Desulfovibrionaceae bacterium]
MILLYTGLGKGKTCACVGQALRALGHNFKVAFAQFIKRPGQAGEQVLLARLLGERFRVQGLGFVREADLAAHRACAKDLVVWALAQLPDLEMLILDEICYALHYKLLTKDEVLNLIHKAQSSNCHVICSGRFAQPWLINLADLVTNFDSPKHPLKMGQKALPGIEF